MNVNRMKKRILLLLLVVPALLKAQDVMTETPRRNERSVAVTEELEREYGLHPAKGRRREKGQGIKAELTAAGADALAAKPEDILTYLHQH